MFIGSTIADKIEIIIINEKPNSVPNGICPVTKGDKKMNSESKSNPINITKKITIERIEKRISE